MSQSHYYSAEVSLPKNWVNEKPKSLIELNTHSYADVLPSLPPTVYSALIFPSSTPQPCVFLFFLTIIWAEVMKGKYVYSLLQPRCKRPTCECVKKVQRASSRDELWGGVGGVGSFQLTSLKMWLKQLMSMSAKRAWTEKGRGGYIYPRTSSFIKYSSHSLLCLYKADILNKPNFTLLTKTNKKT